MKPAGVGQNGSYAKSNIILMFEKREAMTLQERWHWRHKLIKAGDDGSQIYKWQRWAAMLPGDGLAAMSVIFERQRYSAAIARHRWRGGERQAASAA